MTAWTELKLRADQIRVGDLVPSWHDRDAPHIPRYEVVDAAHWPPLRDMPNINIVVSDGDATYPTQYHPHDEVLVRRSLPDGGNPRCATPAPTSPAPH